MRTLRLPGGVEARIHVAASDSAGAFTLLTDRCPPGWSLPPHRHARESETILVTAGAQWLDVDGERRELHAGDSAHVPAGTPHAGGTLGDAAVHRALVFSPAGMERFFAALAEASEPGEQLALARRHGWTFG